MSHYFSLFFLPEIATQPILKNWQVKEGQGIQAGQTLLVYGEGSMQKEWISPVAGRVKVLLEMEGAQLAPGMEILVLEILSEVLDSAVNKNWGRVITPEEAKSAEQHADVATIRLPPETSLS